MNQRIYRWVICGCSAVLMFVTTGLSINVFSVYQPYIISQNQFTNTQGSLLVTVAGMVKWYVPARRKDVSFCRNDCLNSSRSDLSSRRRVFIRFESTR